MKKKQHKPRPREITSKLRYEDWQHEQREFDRTAEQSRDLSQQYRTGR